MMARAWRAVGKLAVGAVAVGTGGTVAAVQLDRFENRYWHRHDPWRSRREDDGKNTEGDNFDDGINQALLTALRVANCKILPGS